MRRKAFELTSFGCRIVVVEDPENISDHPHVQTQFNIPWVCDDVLIHFGPYQIVVEAGGDRRFQHELFMQFVADHSVEKDYDLWRWNVRHTHEEDDGNCAGCDIMDQMRDRFLKGVIGDVS